LIPSKISMGLSAYFYSMNTEVNAIIRRIENINSGEPWFGRAVYTLLEEVNEKRVYERPNNTEHSMIDILYHMITWAEFTLNRLEKNTIKDLAAAEELDWRTIDRKTHTWKKGLTSFRAIHKKIMAVLKKKDDLFLNEIVDYRKYNYRFLINGMIEHTIYHLGQIAYLKKLLA
jgi:uncharacterized damage-inducible protein DinB